MHYKTQDLQEQFPIIQSVNENQWSWLYCNSERLEVPYDETNECFFQISQLSDIVFIVYPGNTVLFRNNENMIQIMLQI